MARGRDRSSDGARPQVDLGARFGADLFEREVDYLIDHEWARTADDVLWRRTKLGLHFTKEERQALERWLRSHPLTMAANAA